MALKSETFTGMWVLINFKMTQSRRHLRSVRKNTSESGRTILKIKQQGVFLSLLLISLRMVKTQNGLDEMQEKPDKSLAKMFRMLPDT